MTLARHWRELAKSRSCIAERRSTRLTSTIEIEFQVVLVVLFLPRLLSAEGMVSACAARSSAITQQRQYLVRNTTWINDDKIRSPLAKLGETARLPCLIFP